MSARTYGRTMGEKPINDDMIEKLADEAERGVRTRPAAGLSPRSWPPTRR